MGFVLCRTRSVVQCTGQPRPQGRNVKEKGGSVLVLLQFLPYRTEGKLNPEGFKSNMEFYDQGLVKLSNGSMRTVKSIVDTNRTMFVKDASQLDKHMG